MTSAPLQTSGGRTGMSSRLELRRGLNDVEARLLIDVLTRQRSSEHKIETGFPWAYLNGSKL